MVWSGWGWLSFLALGLGIVASGPIAQISNLPNGRMWSAVAFALAAAFNAVLAYAVYPRLDRPQPVLEPRELPQPVRESDGTIRTTETVQAVDAGGRPLWTRPTSRLFLIPARKIWMVFLAIALILGVIGTFTG